MSEQPKIDWDDIWKSQDSKNNMMKFYNNIVYFWLELSKMFNSHIDKFKVKNKKYNFIELGCGGGNFLPYFRMKYRNFDIFGVDKSYNGCKTAFYRLKNQKNDFDIICGDILNEAIKNELFDIVFSFGLIEHFNDPKIALEKHVDLLKKEGLLLCVIPNLLGSQGKLLTSKNWFADDDPGKGTGFIYGMKKITIDDLENWAKQIKLQKIKILPISGILPMFIFSTIGAAKNSKLTLAKTFHHYILINIFISINILTLFRINSISFSPYILLVGRK